MKKKLGKRLSAVLTAGILTAQMAVTVGAAGAVNTPVDGTTTTFNKYLVMDEGANVPNTTFSYTIETGATVAATGTTPEVRAGSDATGTPTIGAAAFSSGDPTGTSAAKLAADDDPALTGSQKYAKKTVTVNFTSVSFPYPGIYRYIITEGTASNPKGITNDAINPRYLDVYIQDADGNGTLSVQGYRLHNNTSVAVKSNGNYAGGRAASGKDTGFDNTYDTKNLTISKTVTGNQGDRGEYFPFTITINGANPSTVYTVDLTKADPSAAVKSQTGVTTAETNPGTQTSDAAGNLTCTYYLKADQSVVIKGIPAGATYTVTEGVLSAEGYTTSYKVTNTDTAEVINDTATGTAYADGSFAVPGKDVNQTAAFTNDRAGTVPTGLFYDMAPYIFMVVIAIASVMIFFFGKRNKKHHA
ncbi:MAG TPA: hypothetical protein PLN48_14195 [Lachnospiraceae bacterium]|nr:hypothetical protein [Lachnospiraceae bacterium]